MPRTRTGSPWRYGFPRLESGRGAHAVVREARRITKRLSTSCGKHSMNRRCEICAYALMPNHWHLLVWPASDGELAAFMQRLTVTHVRRWQQYRGYAGLGHVYQGRYKSFPWKATSIFGLWRGTWSAMRCAPIWSRERRIGGGRVCGDGVTERRRSSRYWQLGPLRCHRIGSSESIKPMTGENWNALRRCVQRGRPYGRPEWQKEIAKRLGSGVGLSSGRPPAKSEKCVQQYACVRQSCFAEIP